MNKTLFASIIMTFALFFSVSYAEWVFNPFTQKIIDNCLSLNKDELKAMDYYEPSINVSLFINETFADDRYVWRSDWTTHDDYPSACTGDEFVQGLGDTLSCAVPTDTDTQLTQEEVQDYVGTMVTGNTETRITVTYDDPNNVFDFVVDDMTSTYNATYESTYNATYESTYNATYDAYGDTTYWTASGTDLYNATTGLKVGIGTSEPLAPLHVYSRSGDDVFDFNDGLIIETAGGEQEPDVMLHYWGYVEEGNYNWTAGMSVSEEFYYLIEGDQLADNNVGLMVECDSSKDVYLVGINTINPYTPSGDGLNVNGDLNVSSGAIYTDGNIELDGYLSHNSDVGIPVAVFTAEESGGLDASQYEFSFGNGVTGASADYSGTRQPVAGTITAMSLQCDSCTGGIGCGTTVEIRDTRSATSCECEISVAGATAGAGCSATCSESFSSGAYLNAYTEADTCACQNCVVTFWVRYG